MDSAARGIRFSLRLPKQQIPRAASAAVLPTHSLGGPRNDNSIGCASEERRLLAVLTRCVIRAFRVVRVGLWLFALSLAGFAQTQTPPAPNTSVVIDGASIFAQQCARCHGDRGQGITSVVTILGPSIQAEHNPGNVMTAMEVGPMHMPQFQYLLTMPQMHAVADYVTQKLAVIPLLEGDLGSGGELFRLYCAPCHNSSARGGALVFTGVNAPDITGKSAALIAGAIRWGPGPMPPFPPSVLDDKQLASIVEYVQYIRRPPLRAGTPMNYYGPVAEGFIAWIAMFVLVGVATLIEKGGKG